MINFTSVSSSFADKLWQVMSALEFPVPPDSPLLPHNPKDGTVTIGAGCNLTCGEASGRAIRR